MAIILNIESSTKSTSVCVSEDGKILSIQEEHEVVSHATKLTPFILEVLKEAKIKMSDLDAIAISNGPGSYTGLRIGLSTAKGLCYALNIPLIAISALVAQANSLIGTNKKHNKLYASVMNSRKEEVYLCLLDSSFNILIKPTAIKVDVFFLQNYRNEELVIAGTGLEKIKKVIQQKNITYIEGLNFSAKDMSHPTFDLFSKSLFVDLAYSEPDYLKPFVIST